MSMTNIGDVVLSCPVIDILRRDFPNAQMEVVVGPKAASLFKDNPNFTLNVFDKRAPLRARIAWFLDVFRRRYDCVVDLRRTGLALFLMARYATPVIGAPSQAHKKQMHLNRLRQIYDFDKPADASYAIVTTPEDERFFEEAVVPGLQECRFVVIAPGAASSDKRWPPQGFAAVADRLALSYKVIFVGDANDAALVGDIQERMRMSALSLAGKIDLRQLAYILKKCAWGLVHDSGVMHLACYLNVPVLVLWGPTDLNRYAPWNSKSVVVRRNDQCPRCRNPESQARHNCMDAIQIEDVMNAARSFIA